MAARSVFKHEFLESTIESLQCFKCKDVPGFSEKLRNRYSCHNNAHQLCEKCKDLGPCACGSTVGKSPNPAIQKMLEDMPMYCPHYNRNCREIFAQAEDLNYHQQVLGTRHVFTNFTKNESTSFFKQIFFFFFSFFTQ